MDMSPAWRRRVRITDGMRSRTCDHSAGGGADGRTRALSTMAIVVGRPPAARKSRTAPSGQAPLRGTTISRPIPGPPSRIPDGLRLASVDGWSGRRSLGSRALRRLRDQLVEEARFALVEAFGVERIGQAQELVVEVVAQLVE